jgi:hypothetical protein
MPRQLRIAGTEKKPIPEIDRAAETLRATREECSAAKDREARAKDALITAMRKHGVTEYVDEDSVPSLVITLSVGPDKVKLVERRTVDLSDPVAEADADRILEEAGDGELNERSLKGPAEARKPRKGGRR